MTTEAEQDDYNEDEEAQVSESDIDNDDPDDEADFVGGDFEEQETEANEDGLTTLALE